MLHSSSVSAGSPIPIYQFQPVDQAMHRTAPFHGKYGKDYSCIRYLL